MAKQPDLYCVEASNDPDTEDPGVSEFFDSKSAALEFAEQQMRLFRCVWVCVKAGYWNRNYNFKIGYVYFWWTPQTEWGDVPESGMGYPESALSTLTDYEEYRPSMAKLTPPKPAKRKIRRWKKGFIGMSVKNARTGRRTVY